MPIAIDERIFADADALAVALAREVANDLRAGIATRGGAIVALSGGTTPRRFLECLSREALDWTRTTVTLADERWVPPQDPRSNERLLRETLLRGAAAAARFVPLYADAVTPEQAYAAIAANVAKLPLPFDAVVLGMGTDGHCASLFPGGDHLDAALQPHSSIRVMTMRAAGADEPRMTLTLAALVDTHALYLQIEGTTKRDVFVRIQGGDVTPAPIRTVLQHSPVTPVSFWCP
ncbi:MAG: 6-phosphogluconolactonase [Rudaea sp.]|nr:6-phosphogluconolactonase [Rudaea sp.]